MLQSYLPMYHRKGEHRTIMKLEDVTMEVLNLFVFWLYSTRRTAILLGLHDLPFLLKIYQFACKFAITALELDCYHAMVERARIIPELIEMYGSSPEPLKAVIQTAVDGIVERSPGFDRTPGSSTKQEILNNYMFGLRIENLTLCSMAMDQLLYVMHMESVFSIKEVEEICRRAEELRYGEKFTAIKYFCVALIHYQRRTQYMSDPEVSISRPLFL